MTKLKALLLILLAGLAVGVWNRGAVAQMVINGYRIFSTMAAPSAPASGFTSYYADSGRVNKLCNEDTSGNVTCTMPPLIITAIPSSDTLSAAGTFSTTLSLPSTYLVVGSTIDIIAHGVYTTTGTASPTFTMLVNAGGTSGLCTPTAGITPITSQTASDWDLSCRIQINTTGNPGAAIAWGDVQIYQVTGTAPQHKSMHNASTVNYITTSAQTVSLQETQTLVSGQTFTLQYLAANMRSPSQ